MPVGSYQLAQMPPNGPVQEAQEAQEARQAPQRYSLSTDNQWKSSKNTLFSKRFLRF